MSRVVITGVGAVTPIGRNVNEFWQNLVAGENGAGRITHFDPSDYGSQIACEVKGFDPAAHFERGEIKKLDRFVQFAIVAAREAFQSSGLRIEDEDPTRIGVLVGCGIGGLETLEEAMETLLAKGPRRVSPFVIPKLILNMASGHISIDLGVKGPNIAIATACATGSHSIGEAMRTIQHGEADVMITGGTEAAITRVGVAGFANMRALSTRNDDPLHASRPFDKERDGFVIGEGAGALILEERERALRRGAPIIAELIGYGTSGDAFHITAPDPAGNGATRSILACLHDAGITPAEVDHINAHGTSTPLNDKLETASIKNALGADRARQVPITSNKSMIGHTLGAAGAIEAIALALTLRDQVIPPTINYEVPDPECDLDCVPNTARRAPVRVGLSNSLGFGGHNATVAMRRHSDDGD
jgi:3-oxoacyl-[acyl-carrier-protein] synthase II